MGTARLRITLSAAHTEEDLAQLIEGGESLGGVKFKVPLPKAGEQVKNCRAVKPRRRKIEQLSNAGCPRPTRSTLEEVLVL